MWRILYTYSGRSLILWQCIRKYCKVSCLNPTTTHCLLREKSIPLKYFYNILGICFACEWTLQPTWTKVYSWMGISWPVIIISCVQFRYQKCWNKNQTFIWLETAVANLINTLATDASENTPHKGKCHCTADFLFDWFGFYQASKTVVHST